MRALSPARATASRLAGSGRDKGTPALLADAGVPGSWPGSRAAALRQGAGQGAARRRATCSRLSSTRACVGTRRCSGHVSRTARREPRAPPAAWRSPAGTRSGSETVASGTNQTPSGNASSDSAATCKASRVLPVPPGPVRVMSLASGSRDHFAQGGKLGFAADERGRLGGEIVRLPIETLERREVDRQSRPG